MDGSEEDEGPDQSEAPDITGLIEVVCLVAAHGKRPVQRRERRSLVVARDRVVHTVDEA